MALPIRTTLEDVEAICAYLNSKPTGASLAEAKTVLDEKVLDGRKLTAFRAWDLIEDGSNGKMQLTDRGRLLAKDKGARKSEVLRQVILSQSPYRSIVERAANRGEATYSATEVATHWHRHFKEEASENDKILNDQAVCFFQIAQGADLGVLVIGRKGQPTRFDFNLDNARHLLSMEPVSSSISSGIHADDVGESEERTPSAPPAEKTSLPEVKRVFLTHGKNLKILEQIKEVVQYGNFEPVVAKDHETAAKPVPEKVMDDMRNCHAAVINVGVEEVLFDKDGNERPQINGNVLIEIGAAMALYGRKFILLVEDGVKLPSNLQGLYECRYTGNELNGPATMKLLKAFNEFR